MNLTAGDLDGVTWMRFRQDAHERLAKLRQRNDADLSLEETAKLRGQISELRYWLSLQPHSHPAEGPAGVVE